MSPRQPAPVWTPAQRDSLRMLIEMTRMGIEIDWNSFGNHYQGTQETIPVPVTSEAQRAVGYLKRKLELCNLHIAVLEERIHEIHRVLASDDE